MGGETYGGKSGSHPVSPCARRRATHGRTPVVKHPSPRALQRTPMGRGTGWTVAERKILARAYLSTTLNSTVGLHQKGSVLWQQSLRGRMGRAWRREKRSRSPLHLKRCLRTVKGFAKLCAVYWLRADRRRAEKLSMAIGIHLGKATIMNPSQNLFPQSKWINHQAYQLLCM